ncbi:hypothetical protein BSG1_13026 [Bacillus sp. SG-1]|nr:hypothetical protein BSG1_13026 [Bacillus sp. SG-1]
MPPWYFSFKLPLNKALFFIFFKGSFLKLCCYLIDIIHTKYLSKQGRNEPLSFPCSERRNLVTRDFSGSNNLYENILFKKNSVINSRKELLSLFGENPSLKIFRNKNLYENKKRYTPLTAKSGGEYTDLFVIID